MTLTAPPAPGIYTSIPSETYHGWDMAGRSALHKIAQGHTLAHVRYGMLHDSPDSDALALGSALHMAMLEPDRYEECIRLGPVNDKTGSTYGRGTKKWEEAETEPGVTLLTTEQAAKILPMVAALRGHPMIAAAFARVEHRELTCVANLDLRELADHLAMPWRESYGEDDHLLTKVRLDAVGAGIVVDLKTQGSGRRKPGPDALQWAAVDYGYMAQSGLYPLVARAAGMGEVEHFAAAVVESDPPHLTYFVRFSDFARECGLRAALPAMVKMARAYRTEEWPGYPPGVIDLDPPESWVRSLESM